MSTATRITADDLYRMPDDGMRSELIAGELRMMSPAGWVHGDVVGRLHVLLGHYILSQRLGRVFGAETGFILSRDPDTVRAPDFAFIANENFPSKKPSSAYWPGAPDLAVEVLSPDDRKSQVEAKNRAWFGAGVKAVWVVDPILKTIAIHSSVSKVETKSVGHIVDGGDLLPGFSCAVADVFGEQA